MAKHPEGKPEKKRSSRSRSTALYQPGPGTKPRVAAGIHSLQGREKVTDNLVKGPSKNRRATVWTVGYSTRPVNDFVALLEPTPSAGSSMCEAFRDRDTIRSSTRINFPNR